MFSCCGGAGSANWDQTNQKWRCSDCGAVQSTDPDYLGGGFTVTLPPTTAIQKSGKKCECGADKVYGPGSGMHSATMPCPLYQKP